MVDVPASTGTVTFFFSDIEGSTRLLEALGPAYDALLERHHAIVRAAFARCAAAEVGTEGDSFFAVFRSAAEAVGAAASVQRALASEAWPRGAELRVRIGLHTGEARVVGGDYVGLDVHRAARIMAAAHGGQVLLSSATGALAGRELGDGLSLRDLGEHRLRDLSGRERLFELVVDGLASDFPPPRTLDAVPNNLPTQATRLVGRRDDLDAVRAHLVSSGARIVTLTGPGGIGKTRLAVQAAAESTDAFPDGVHLVDLSQAWDADAVLDAIVRAVGIPALGDAPLDDALAEHFRPRRALLVLDNFEQVVEAAGEVVRLVERCPRLRVLVTSREALRVRGEQLVPLAPLPVPAVDPARATADELARFDAVRLFVERAQQAQPSFALRDDNAAVVAEICRELDGLPLAIELAAARLRLFAPDELRDRLRSRLDVLRGGARDLPERQRTMRSAIEWSDELLDADERAVLQLLSVFSGARVATVEAVAARVDRLAGVDVVDRLSSLVDKSLVRSVEDARGQRLSLLGVIREYAAERLADDAAFAAAARDAHAEHFAAFAEARRGAAARDGRDVAVAELADEAGNLRAAWRTFRDAGDGGGLNRLLDGLWLLHEARGWYHGAVALTHDLLALGAAGSGDDEITLRLGLARGLLAIGGYTGEVEELYREALALADAAGSLPRRLPVLRSLASFYLYRAEIEKTAEIGREVLELAEQEADARIELEGHLIVGPATAFLGDGRAGLAHLERALELFDPERHEATRFRLGPSPGVAAAAVSALLNWLFGRPDTAARRAAHALALAGRLQHPYSLAYGSFHVGLLDVWSDRPEAAAARARDVLAIAEEHDYRIWTALGLVLDGVATASLGDADEGLARTERGVSLYEDLRTPPVFWPQILGLYADASALAGRSAEALELVDRAFAFAVPGSWDAATLGVQRADLLRASGDAGAAGDALRQAFADARAGGARMVELRAATRLAALGEPVDGRDPAAVLREVLGAFDEGFDTPDLRAALAVLGAGR